MAKKSHPIRSLLHPSRVIIPILLGLGVASFLLYNNLKDLRFERTPDGLGNYSWHDSNGNGFPDLQNESEFFISEKGNFKKITFQEILASVNWTWYSTFWIVAALVMMATRDVAYMYRIRVLSNNELSWRKAFDVIMLWEFASAVTPSAVGGAPLAILIVNKEGINVGRSTTIVLLTSLLDEIFFITMVPVLYFLMSNKNMFPFESSISLFNLHTGIKLVFITSYSLILFYCIIISFGIFISPAGFKKILISLFKLPILKKWPHFAIKTGDEIIIASGEIKKMSASFWAKVFTATYFSWTARYMVVNCIILAFATVKSDPLLIYARQLVMWIIMLISPTPGSSGIAEYAFSVYLKEFIPNGLNSTLAFIWRIISYYPYLFIGAIILPAWIKRVYFKRKLISFKKD